MPKKTWEPITVYRTKCGSFMVIKEGKGKNACWNAYLQDDGTWFSKVDLTGFATAEDAMAWLGFGTAEDAMAAIIRLTENS